MLEGEILNALIRCRRKDRIAHPEFELVKEEAGIWVRELPFENTGGADESIGAIIDDLMRIRPSLDRIGRGSEDFTLHLAYEPPEYGRLILPTNLCNLAGDCGFSIELIVDSED